MVEGSVVDDCQPSAMDIGPTLVDMLNLEYGKWQQAKC